MGVNRMMVSWFVHIAIIQKIGGKGAFAL